MAARATVRGVLLGQCYLSEVAAIEVILGLQDIATLTSAFLELAGQTHPLVQRAIRAENALRRVAHELEAALGNSADD
jgi:hypothetical protein